MIASSWQSAERVLCVRLDALGDVLMTGPAMRALRAVRPGRRLTLLTSPAGAGAGKLMPEVDELIVYDAPWMKSRAADVDRRYDGALVDQLAERGFEAAVIFTVYSQSALPAALMCHLAGIPLCLAHCRENPYRLLSDWVRESEPDQHVRHEVRRQLDLVATVGATTTDERLGLALPDAAHAAIDELLAMAGVDRGCRWLVVHPGASAPSRRYPPESWQAVCRALAEHGVQLVLTGSEGERQQVDGILAAAGVPAVSLAGQLELSELAALLQAAPALLSGNTGPVHLAAAGSTPVVDVYALTNPQHTPWGVPSRVLSHDVPCRWCYGSVCHAGHHRCVREVRPAQVVEAALELLSEQGGLRRPAARPVGGS